MRSKSIFPLFAILAFAACSKAENPQVGASDAFSCEDMYFETFQEAVNVASTIVSDGVVTITLNKDVTDNGAVFPSGNTLNIMLNLGANTYNINSGSAIEIGSNYFEVTGSGGSIRSSGEEFTIKCSKDGFLNLSGQMTLSSDNLLSSSSIVIVNSDFSGSIVGNVSLNGAPFHLSASTGTVNIPVLSVYGDEAVFSSNALENEAIGTTSIGEVHSDREFPVVSIRKDAVSVLAGKVHVHDLKCCKVEGTCCIPDSYMLVCKDCDYEIADYNEHEVTYGKCNSENLIKHERIEPDICQFGYVEHYECPDCGRVYLNKGSSSGSCEEANVILLPTNIDSIVDASYTNAGQARTLSTWAAELIVGIIGFVPGAVTTEISTWTTPVTEFRNFSQRLTQLSTRLDSISHQITKIAREVQTVPYKIKVQNRLAELTQLKILNQNTNQVLGLVFNNPKYNQKQMDSLKVLHIKQWSGIYPGSTATLHPHEIVMTLMNDFHTVAIGPNIPQMYGEVLSSYFPWEHMGYTARTLMLLYDVVVVSTAYYYAQNYARTVKPYSSELMQYSYMKTLEQSYKKYSEAVLAELERMKERGDKYRRYMPTNTTYDRNIYTSFDFASFLNKKGPHYLPREDARVSINTCNNMMEYNGGKLIGTSFMDSQVAKETQQYYRKMMGAGKLPKDFPSGLTMYGLLDSLGFKAPFQNKAFRLLMNAPQSFSYAKGDIEFPMYWNVKWRSYKGLLDNDWIDVAPVMDINGKICDERIVWRCNIKTSNGLVSGIELDPFGKSAIFGAIRVVSQDQKPIKEN